MKKKIIMIFASIISNIQAQNIIVVDSINHKPIPFVNIYFSSGEGTFTDEKGIFKLNNRINDTLKISHISHSTLEILASKLKDTVILVPDAIILKEVVINNGKKTSKYIDFPKKNSSFSSFSVSSKSELVTLIIPNESIINSSISKLEFKFVKRFFDDNAINNKTAFRINIYEAKNKKIKSRIFSSETFIIDATKKEKIELNLKNEDIIFENNGVFIGIELIGNIGLNGEILYDKSIIRPILTENKVEDYTAESFLKNTFDQKSILIPLNNILEKISGKKVSRYVSFGLTLVK